MKQYSIKAKVTVWYTLLVFILVMLGLLYIFIFTNRLLHVKSEEILSRVVMETIETIEFDGNELDDDIEYYNEGVSIFLYDANGVLLEPQSTKGITVNALLEDGITKTVKVKTEDWLVFDQYIQIEGRWIWIRGIITVTETMKTIQMMCFVALIVAPFFLIIAGIGGYSLIRHAFRPIDKIIETVEAMNDGADLSRRIGYNNKKTKDEVTKLAQTFDKMFDRLQVAFETEKQFTADASHELRTPIAIIISQCEYGLSKENNQHEIRLVLETILRQSKKMSSLISQLLIFAKIDNGGMKLEFEQINVSELCELVCEELMETAKKYTVNLKTEITSDLYMEAEQTLLLRMLTNLITNAIYYNKKGGTVWITVEKRKEIILIQVKDNGIGISEEQIEKIWNRFYRVDQCRNREKGNSGLGLSMVQWIVSVHKGTIRVESELGKGSTFKIFLPN